MKKQSEQERKHFLHKTRNRKLKEVSRFSRVNNGTRLCQKEKLLHVQSCVFLLIRKKKCAARANLFFC